MKYVQGRQPFYIRNSATITLGVGLLFFAGVVLIYASQYFFIKKAYRTTGKVIGFEIPKGKVLKRPVIEYYTPNLQRYTYYHTEGTNPPEYRLGEEIPVYYDSTNPEEVSLGYSFIPMIILGIFGLAFTGLGMAMRN
jgi:hypothetical protein